MIKYPVINVSPATVKNRKKKERKAAAAAKKAEEEAEGAGGGAEPEVRLSEPAVEAVD